MFAPVAHAERCVRLLFHHLMRSSILSPSLHSLHRLHLIAGGHIHSPALKYAVSFVLCLPLDTVGLVPQNGQANKVAEGNADSRCGLFASGSGFIKS